MIETFWGVEQVCQQGEGFSRNEFAANALAGELSALEKKDVGTCAGGSDRGGAACGAAADYS